MSIDIRTGDRGVGGEPRRRVGGRQETEGREIGGQVAGGRR
jgi:hypothetical protein